MGFQYRKGARLERPFEQSIRKLTVSESSDYPLSHLKELLRYFGVPSRNKARVRADVWRLLVEVQELLNAGFTFHYSIVIGSSWKCPPEYFIAREVSFDKARDLLLDAKFGRGDFKYLVRRSSD